MATAETFGLNAERVLDLGCAMEFVHVSSLILDDLPCMDDAIMRRGKPACHRTHGEDIAILAAFGLLSRAFEIVSSAVHGLPVERYAVRDYIETLSRATGFSGMVGGQVQDLHPPEHIDFHSLEYIHSHKTGALFVASASCGAYAAQAKLKHLEGIRTFSKNLGLAFQIQDDLLDVLSTPAITGKETNTPHRKTFVDLFGVERCREAVDTLFETVEDTLRTFPGGAPLLQGLVEHVRRRSS